MSVLRRLLQSFEEMIPNAQRVSHGCQGRIHRADAGEKAGIDHVQVIQFMCLTVLIQGRRLWILPEATGSGLVRYSGNRNEALHVGIAMDQMVRVHAKVIEHGLEFVVEFLLCHLVIGCVAQSDLPLLVDGDAIVGIGQVFGGEPEVDGMTRDITKREHRRQLCLNGLSPLYIDAWDLPTI